MDPSGQQSSAIPEPARGSAREFVNSADSSLTPVQEIRDLYRYGYLLRRLVHRDVTVRYKRSILGFGWTMLNPMLMMVVLTIVFSQIFRFAVDHFETYFLSEYLGWMYFSQTTVGAMLGMSWNGPLLKRVRVPPSIFAVAATTSGLVNLVLAMGPLILIMLFVGAPLRPAMLFLPVSFLLLAMFTLGISLAISSLAVYFADIREMYQVAILGVMYLTPIFYPISIVPLKYKWLVELNPLLYLLQNIRDPIYGGTIPTLRSLVVSCACVAVSLVLGWITFRKLSHGFYAQL